MTATFHSGFWPSNIKFVSNWPTLTTRLGDLGYVDSSGSWRTILNVLDAVQCRQHGIEPLTLTRAASEYLTQIPFNGSPRDLLVKVSRGWECRLMNDSELKSAEWDTMSTLANPQLINSRPRQGIEIRRTSTAPYLPLSALIIGSTIFVRKLQLRVEFMKLWLEMNWPKIHHTTTAFQNAFPPVAEYTEISLALTEFITKKWTAVYDDGDTAHVDWLPIALGITAELVCDNIQLPRPTMRGRIGTEESPGNYVIGCDGIEIRRLSLKARVMRRVTNIICCGDTGGGYISDDESIFSPE